VVAERVPELKVLNATEDLDAAEPAQNAAAPAQSVAVGAQNAAAPAQSVAVGARNVAVPVQSVVVVDLTAAEDHAASAVHNVEVYPHVAPVVVGHNYVQVGRDVAPASRFVHGVRDDPFPPVVGSVPAGLVVQPVRAVRLGQAVRGVQRAIQCLMKEAAREQTSGVALA
jgi:hypothetical protein